MMSFCGCLRCVITVVFVTLHCVLSTLQRFQAKPVTQPQVDMHCAGDHLLTSSQNQAEWDCSSETLCGSAVT